MQLICLEYPKCYAVTFDSTMTFWYADIQRALTRAEQNLQGKKIPYQHISHLENRSYIVICEFDTLPTINTHPELFI